jgi:plasmid stabilization system protein ParE
MKLRWSTRAERDLYAIADFIALDDPGAAIDWIDRLRERARKAAAMPQAGRSGPELGRQDIREVFVGNYRIVYRIEPRGVLVLTVHEGHRQLPADLVEE